MNASLNVELRNKLEKIATARSHGNVTEVRERQLEFLKWFVEIQ